ncbi:hypothetical protein C8Q74DRAFT_1242776 [Fomes fomentarius]|nr:hypothetical protein C8Q74DRAFT_1242776 [Fomes fomentarius]
MSPVPSVAFTTFTQLPSNETLIDKVRELFRTLVEWVSQVSTRVQEYVKEHPDEVKIWGVRLAIATIFLWLFWSPIMHVLRGLFEFVRTILDFILTPVKWVLRGIWYVIKSLVKGILGILGFETGGVRSDSLASRVQSAHYGAYTGGTFSRLQSSGATNVEF